MRHTNASVTRRRGTGLSAYSDALKRSSDISTSGDPQPGIWGSAPAYPYFSAYSGRTRLSAAAWYDSRITVATDKTDREKAQRHLADNRKAFHDYHVLETWEAGLALLGTEVKAIREGSVNLRDSYARVENGEVWLMNLHVSPYSHTGYAHHDERRNRKLLLHRHEIAKLTGRVVERGLTLVPLRMYLKNGRVKVALALVKGKQEHDKRETIRRREVDRETRAAVKARR